MPSMVTCYLYIRQLFASHGVLLEMQLQCLVAFGIFNESIIATWIATTVKNEVFQRCSRGAKLKVIDTRTGTAGSCAAAAGGGTEAVT